MTFLFIPKQGMKILVFNEEEINRKILLGETRKIGNQQDNNFIGTKLRF
jgi:hypothetical protein